MCDSDPIKRFFLGVNFKYPEELARILMSSDQIMASIIRNYSAPLTIVAISGPIYFGSPSVQPSHLLRSSGDVVEISFRFNRRT